MKNIGRLTDLHVSGVLYPSEVVMPYHHSTEERKERARRRKRGRHREIHKEQRRSLAVAQRRWERKGKESKKKEGEGGEAKEGGGGEKRGEGRKRGERRRGGETDRGGTRTLNLPIRSRTPYPLGHAAANRKSICCAAFLNPDV